MTPTDAQALLDAPKIAQHWSGFVKRDNHAGHIIGSAQLTDERGVYIPGLTLEIEVKAAAVSAQCLFQFSLRHRVGRQKEVVYQLEVTPQGKRSHNGLIPIHGPHEHLGNGEPSPVQETGVNCENWDGCMNWFLSRSGITGLQVERPC